MMFVQRVDTPDGISWYTETFELTNDASSDLTRENIVLIPSGEGDCTNLRALAQCLASNGRYRVVTFDMPGMSRTSAPPAAYTKVTHEMLANQIVGLLDALRVPRASFFGCSSGGIATLSICAFHSARAKCGIVHEAPLSSVGPLNELQELTDEEITSTFKGGMFENMLVERDENDGHKKWKALGPEYHARLLRNFVTWVRSYVNSVEVTGMDLLKAPKNLQRRPIFWTVGALNPGAADGEGAFKSNFEAARKAGLEVNTKRLNCLHFPSVTVTEECAEWIAECIGKVSD